MSYSKRLLKLIAYSFVAGLASTALAVSLVRLALAEVDGFRERLERVASEVVGQPVRVGGLAARLNGITPAFALTDLTLLDAPGGRVVARLEEARLDLDLVASVRNRRPQLERLVVSGARLAVERHADGSFRVRGLGHDGEGDIGDGAGVGGWLLAQPRLALRDGELVWRDYRAGADVRFEDVDLEFAGVGDRHRLAGSLRAPGGGRLRVVAEVDGDPLLGDFRARTYLFGEGLQPLTWVAPVAYAGVRAAAGRVGFELWGDWDHGHLRAVEGNATLRGVRLEGPEAAVPVERASARLRLVRDPRQWRLDLADVQVQGPGGAWPSLRAALESVPGGMEVRLSELDVAAVSELAPLWPEAGRWQQRLQPRGRVRDIVTRFGAGGPRIEAGFTDLASEAWDQVPGVTGLDGRVAIDGDAGTVQLATRDAELHLPRLFRGVLPVEALDGTLRVSRLGEGWHLAGRGLSLANADIRAVAAVDLELEPGRSPFLDLRGRFFDGRAVAVPRYLPAHIMGPSAVAWLDDAFLSGRAPSGHMLFHGRTADFPFHDGSGRFEVAFDGEGVELAYQPGWPTLRNTAAHVVFEGEGMDIRARGADVLSGRVTRAHVRIPTFDDAQLLVDGEVSLPGADALKVLRDTPLARHMPDLSSLEAGGHTRVALELVIPLTSRVAEARPLQVAGQAHLEDAWLRLPGGIAVESARGAVAFDHRGRLRGDGVRARMFGHPARISVFSEADGATGVAAHGRIDGAAVTGELGLGIGRYLEGSTPWQAALMFQRGRTRLDVSSDLEQMAVTLPPPLAKPAQGRRPLSVAVELEGPEAGRTAISYQDGLQAELQLGASGGLERGALHLGPGSAPALPEQQLIRVTGRIEGGTARQWRTLAQGMDAADGASPATAPVPIEVTLERLALAAEPAEGPADRPLPAALRSLPPLDVSVADLRVGGSRLGDLRLRTRPRSDGMLVEDLTLQSDAFRLTGKGRWRRDGHQDATRLELRLRADSAGAMMDRLGFASVITAGELKADGTLEWPGAPAEFAVGRLGGEVEGRIRDGRIDDVDPGSGRILGLFSLRALPKRLSLDFSDLFGRGMSFDRIEGRFRLEQGNAWSDDLRMDAPSAQVLMRGRTGLAERDYAQRVSVVPNLSGGLALAGGLALGPQVGAALLLLQRVLDEPIDRASMFHYSVTGSWEEPQVERLARAP